MKTIYNWEGPPNINYTDSPKPSRYCFLNFFFRSVWQNKIKILLRRFRFQSSFRFHLRPAGFMGKSLDHSSCRIKLWQRIERFHMTSRRPCWCSEPGWENVWELKSFLMQTLRFVPINLHRCWPRVWKHSCKKNLKFAIVILLTAYTAWLLDLPASQKVLEREARAGDFFNVFCDKVNLSDTLHVVAVHPLKQADSKRSSKCLKQVFHLQG